MTWTQLLEIYFVKHLKRKNKVIVRKPEKIRHCAYIIVSRLKILIVFHWLTIDRDFLKKMN